MTEQNYAEMDTDDLLKVAMNGVTYARENGDLDEHRVEQLDEMGRTLNAIWQEVRLQQTPE